MLAKIARTAAGNAHTGNLGGKENNSISCTYRRRAGGEKEESIIYFFL